MKDKAALTKSSEISRYYVCIYATEHAHSVRINVSTSDLRPPDLLILRTLLQPSVTGTRSRV